jgi:hypothetical protein
MWTEFVWLRIKGEECVEEGVVSFSRRTLRHGVRLPPEVHPFLCALLTRHGRCAGVASCSLNRICSERTIVVTEQAKYVEQVGLCEDTAMKGER